jgi:hypothetical protein
MPLALAPTGWIAALWQRYSASAKAGENDVQVKSTPVGIVSDRTAQPREMDRYEVSGWPYGGAARTSATMGSAGRCASMSLQVQAT